MKNSSISNLAHTYARSVLVLFVALSLGACLGTPEGIQPVKDFNLNRYLGTWYEIARLDHPFERGLENISANYSYREDGGVRVINRGFDTNKQEWQQAEGKAFFVEEEDVGYLKVSFFGPFYGSYVVFELDQIDYQHAYVTGPDRSYLWLLSRTPRVSDARMKHFKNTIRRLGFEEDQLIFVDHSNP